MNNAASKTKSRARVTLALCVALGFASVGVMRVHRRQRVVQLGYSLSHASAELLKLEEESRRLTLELSMLTSPERIEALASSMGFVRPAPEQVRTLRPQALAKHP